MNSMSEQWWEKKLNIRTSGEVDHFIEEACNPYEPTDYRVLEALADSGYITSESHVLDYGCGKGRTAQRAMCSITGAGKGAQPYFSVSGRAAGRPGSNSTGNSAMKP